MEEDRHPLLSNKTYDILKFFVQYFLPGAGTLYFSLSQIWGFLYGEQVVGTTSALAIFLGLLLGISNKSYNASSEKYDGALVVDTTDPMKDLYTYEVYKPLEDLAGKSEVLLQVKEDSQ